MHRRDRRIAVAALACCSLGVSCVDIVGPDTTPASKPATVDSTSTPPPSNPGTGTPAPSVADTSVLRIVTTTLGTDLDPDGYTIRLSTLLDDSTRVVPANGRLDLSLPVRTHVVSLLGIAPNCSISESRWWGTAVEVALPRATTEEPAAQASFTVRCEPIPAARLADGTQLAFVRDGQVWLVNSDGTNPRRLTDGPGDEDPAWSADGRRIAFTRQEAIHIMDADGSNLIRLSDRRAARQPTWSPDGRRLAFASFCPADDPFRTNGCVLIASTDPTDTTRTSVGWPRGWHDSPAWSPDGTRIAFVSDWVAFDFVADLYVETLTNRKMVQLTSGFRDWEEGPIFRYEQPAWSPDGRQLAVIGCPTSYYICDSSDLLVMNADGSGERRLRTPRAGTPTWSPDGRTIAFSVGALSPFGYLSSMATGSIEWISADGTNRGIIVANGHSPAWRPSP